MALTVSKVISTIQGAFGSRTGWWKGLNMNSVEALGKALSLCGSFVFCPPGLAHEGHSGCCSPAVLNQPGQIRAPGGHRGTFFTVPPWGEPTVI